jgi:predicted transcriptional regulator
VRLERMLRKTDTNQRRSNLEITAEILKIARGGSNKTRIVYSANLNFKMLSEYLARLEAAGLVSYSLNNGGLIKTTSKGKEYLDQFKSLKSFY